ncbi:MAG: ABC-type branched-chain amino acid transport system, permease component [Acidimicrobiales bacterium]|nr:ABC-type branched-chain amino acid transport system, permease component [Acidimicrobiales bacterium]
MTSVLERVQKLAAPTGNRATDAARRAGMWVVGAVAFCVAVQAYLNPPIGSFFNGAVTGALYGLIAVGVILIYRTNRIVNFACAGLGAVPGIFCALLINFRHWSWYVAFPLCLVMGVVLGAVVEFAVIRRFANAPRLILTVATIGISQILAYIGVYIPIWMGSKGKNVAALQTPFSTHHFRIGNERFSYDYLFAVVVILVVVTLLAAFLRYTRIGIALRASAENADRASLLGIPVAQVQTVAWMIAGLLASLAIFLRASVVGVPTDGSLGFKVLIFVLAAAVIAKMENIGTALVAGVAIGIIAEATLVKTGKDSLANAYMLVVILAALLLQRGRRSRAYDTGVSSWQAVKEFRPVPHELRDVREVRWFRGTVAVVVAAFFLGFPYIVGNNRVGFTELVIIECIVAVSLVMLTGWAGQISLGQFAIVGVGAAIGGKLAAGHNVDFFVAVGAGVLAGALAAVLIGLPALRLPGLYLAVTTLALGAFVQYVLLDRSYAISRALAPATYSQIRTPVLWQRIKLGSDLGPARAYYYVCLAFLGAAVLMARAYRRNRAGRAVMAVRDNVRAASSYSVDPIRTKLAAFAVSGAIAGLAGVLLAYQSGAVDPATYGIDKSISIFLIVVIGGLTSLSGAIFGTVLLECIRFFGEDFTGVKNLSLLTTGPGLLLVLLFLPGGFAEGMYRIRDWFLRRVAMKHAINVPSLVADRRVETQAERDVVIQAEHRVEEVDSFDVVAERSIVCPVCGEHLSLDAAADHEHLRVGAPT